MSAAAAVDREKLDRAVTVASGMLVSGSSGSAIILELVKFHGGSYRDANNTYELRVAGVGKSCTAGPISLLRAWLEKARRTLAGQVSK